MFQPANVYPVLVKLFVVIAVVVPETMLWFDIVPEPELLLNATTFPSAVQSAYSVKFAVCPCA